VGAAAHGRLARAELEEKEAIEEIYQYICYHSGKPITCVSLLFLKSLIQRLDFSIDARLYGLLDIIHRLSLSSRFNYTYRMHEGAPKKCLKPPWHRSISCIC
jgi:hypothetical protein